MIKKSSFYKFLLSIIITLVILILCKSNSNFKSILYKKVYQENIYFMDINNFYKSKFGLQLPFLEHFNNTRTVFSEKLKYNDISIYKDGFNLSVDENYIVPAIEEGVVVFIGEKEGYGKTIIIESSNNLSIWYSNLDDINLNMYDYIKKGDLIGNVKNNLYLVFIKDGEHIDYKEYI